MILVGFQLRAAIKALNLTLNDWSKITQVSKITLSRLVNTINNLDEITCSAQDAQKLFTYFNNNKLIFKDKHRIELDNDVEGRSTSNNLTRFQFIAARAATGLSLRGLEKYIDLSYGAVSRFERLNNNFYIKSEKIETRKFILFFNQEGIYFPDNKSIFVKK